MDGGMGTSVELKATKLIKVRGDGGRIGRWRRCYTTGVTGTLPGFGFGPESLASSLGIDVHIEDYETAVAIAAAHGKDIEGRNHGCAE